MKLTKKTTKTAVETTEIVCEISQEEFSMMCAETVAKLVVSRLDNPIDGEELMHGIAMTALLAEFAHEMDKKLFNYKNENPDNKEEK